MKICSKCDARQKDSRIFCVDCGEKLGEKISEEEKENIERGTEKKFKKYLRNTYLMPTGLADKIMSSISAISAIATIVLMIVLKDFKNFPVYLAALTLLIFSAAYGLIPGLLWRYRKFQLSFTVDISDDAEPTDVYEAMRKVAIYGGFIIAMFLIAMCVF